MPRHRNKKKVVKKGNLLHISASFVFSVRWPGFDELDAIVCDWLGAMYALFKAIEVERET